jgi:murein DD-endopeptidase MepM/ murein hydrolase activator NlpD
MPKASPVGTVAAESLAPVSAPVAAPAAPAAPAAEEAAAPAWASDPQPELILASTRSRARSRAAEKTATALVKATGPVESGAGSTHILVVKKGDTVKLIAERMQVSEEAVIKANRLRHPSDLEVGMKLKVPTAKAYVVQHGDTLYAISRRFGVPVPTLEEINQFEHGARLRTGQRVALPGAPAEPAKPERAARGGARPIPLRREEEYTPPAAQPQSVVPPRTTPTPSREPSGPPSGPVPYSSLPGHLTGPAIQPPERAPTAPRYNPPASQGPITPPVAPNGPPVVEAAPPPTDDQIVAAGRGRFVWPVQGETISGYGPKVDGQRNDGVDIGAVLNAPVVAAAAGDVVYAGNQVPGFGNLVLIKHPDGWVTAYAHLSSTEVKIKDRVAQGTEIGRVGETGGATQPELHFEIRYAPTPRDKARPVDPSLLLGAQ